MLSWWKLVEYAKAAADAIGVPAVVIILILGYHVSMTQAQLEAHNAKTIEVMDKMRLEQAESTRYAKTEQEKKFERMVNFLKAICVNTAVYDKNLMRACVNL